MNRAIALMVSVALSLVATVGCAAGPSAQQVRTAKLAEYNADTRQLLDVAIQVAQKKYQIEPGDIDPNGRFLTAPQWYSADGMRRGKSNQGNGDYLMNSGGGDIRLSLEVQVVPGPGGRSLVAVTPRVLQMMAGSPQPRPLVPDDPNMPGWVKGRVDQLTVDIHAAAKPYEQKL